MRYARLGNTGLVVSRLGFGAMTFGSDQGPMGAVWKVDQKLADAMVGRSLDAGVNLFDTADMYAGGQSETMLGKALGKRRREVVIATKAGFRASPAVVDSGLSRRHLLASVEGSLRRLGTDYIDLYQIHRKDVHTPLEETLEALNDLVRRGMVRYVGYSNLPAWEASKAFAIQTERRWAGFRAAQMYYSLVGRDIEHETVPFLKDAGIGLLVWSPLAGGFLTGRYTRENPKGDKGRISESDFLPTDRERGYRIVDALKRIGAAHDAPVAQAAIAWLLSKPFVTSVLIGASKLDQLEQNLGAADVALSQAEADELDGLTAPAVLYPDWFNAKTADAVVKKALEVSARSL